MIESRLQITDDGSHTLFNQRVGENYHSSFGAIQESKHIFIDAGLNTTIRSGLKQVNILEIGTGTGLNLLLSYIWSTDTGIPVNYKGFEPYPISKEEAILLNYPDQLFVDQKLFLSIHENTGKLRRFSNGFSFVVEEAHIQKAKLTSDFYDIVFFDAFSPESQPEMWSVDIFSRIYNSLTYNGVLTTYSCKGVVKRALIDSGFRIEKLPGPPGKREFLRAWKS